MYYFYAGPKKTLPLLCDMTTDKGDWTLVLARATFDWSEKDVDGRNENSPLSEDYSILGKIRHGRIIRSKPYYTLRITVGGTESCRNSGGIWKVPTACGFLPYSRPSQCKNVETVQGKGLFGDSLPWLFVDGSRRTVVLTLAKTRTVSEMTGNIVANNPRLNKWPNNCKPSFVKLWMK